MINKILEKLNNENKNELISEYNNILIEAKNSGAEIKLTRKNQAVLLLQAMDNVISKNSSEQYNHLEKTAKLASLFASELHLNQTDKQNLILLARYHDIGKINISKDILNKPSKLNEQEWEKIKKHPIYSYEILNIFSGLSEVALGALSHHEWFDGTGYPAKLAGEEIPMLSRVIAILDTYEVLTSGRVYKAPVSEQDALLEINKCAGTQFDPKLVKVFEGFITKTNEAEVAQEKEIEHIL